MTWPQLLLVLVAIGYGAAVVVDAIHKLKGEVSGARWQAEKMEERLQFIERHLRSIEFRSRNKGKDFNQGDTD